MRNVDESLFPGHDVIWLADYTVRKRRKKLFDKDERARERMWGKNFKPTPCFASELEAREYMVCAAQSEVHKIREELRKASRRLELAKARRDIAAEAPPQ